MKLHPNFKQDGPYMETREYGASLRRDPSTLTEGERGVYMGHHPAEGRGPWAEEGGPPYRESRTTRLGRLEPVERRAPTYQEELEQQIQEKQERRRLEKAERDRAEAKLEAEMKNYNPWGRGGCGAPLRDTRGDLITDLKQMHRQNEDAWLNPQRKANVTRPNLREDRLPPINTVSGSDHVRTSDISRSLFANQQTGAHWRHHLAEGRGPWAEEGGPPYRESRTTRLGKVEPVEWRAPTYQEELEQQIQEKQERRRLEKAERDRAEAKLEAEIKNYDPWGRGGCGAPLRDNQGDLITDLKQMHRQNEEAWLNPETSQKKAPRPILREDRLPPINTVSGFAPVQTSMFPNQPTLHQLTELDKYKLALKQQIEEKRLKESEEREKLRLEEAKEERRLAEQRAEMKWEFDEDKEIRKLMAMEKRGKNKELFRLAEEKKKEVEEKRKEVEEKEIATGRMRYEKERQARIQEVRREISPPIPTLQKRHRAPQSTSSPPSMDSKCPTTPMPKGSLSGLQSQTPSVPAVRKELRAAGCLPEYKREVLSKLSAIRQKLLREQKRAEGQMMRSE